MLILQVAFICFAFSPRLANTLNILVLEELASGSHHLWLQHIVNALAANGHNVTSLSDTVYPNPPEGVHYIHLEKVLEYCFGSDTDEFDFFDVGSADPIAQIRQHYAFYEKQCSGAVASDGWRQLMEYPDDFKFDLVIHDFVGGFCYLAFLHKFNNPTLITASAASDVSIPASIQNSVLTPSISHFMVVKDLQVTLMDRLRNYLYFVINIWMRYTYLYPRLDAILRESQNSTIPSINDLHQRSEIILLNLDPLVTGVEQHPPNLISVGGLQIQPVKALPSRLQTIVETSRKGVVLFSLGTNVPLHKAGAERLSQIFNAFGRLPEFTFLCKFDANHLVVEVPENVKLEPWLPQNDILANPKTVLFITHGGLLSSQEAIWHGVPMLGMPIFIDQYMNSAQSTQKGIGETLQWPDLTTETMYNKLEQILNNPSYRETIDDYSALFRDQKETPLERAVWWIEWVMRHPKRCHLRRYSGDLNFMQRQSIDVLAVLIICLLLLVGLMILLFGIMFRMMSCMLKRSKKKLD